MELRDIIAERVAAREKDRPTPELLRKAASLIQSVVSMHPDFHGEEFVLGQDWKHLVGQLRSGAEHLRQ
jgi:hypothetical protein